MQLSIPVMVQLIAIAATSVLATPIADLSLPAPIANLSLPTPIANLSLHTPSIPVITEAMILFIAPNSSTCAGAEKPSECMTAKTIAGLDLRAIAGKFNITTKGEFAAAIITMAMQSNDFKFNNRTTGFDAQGTYGMQWSALLWYYAEAIAKKHDPSDSAFITAFQALPPGPYLGHSSSIANSLTLIKLFNSHPQIALGAAFWFIGREDPLILLRQRLQRNDSRAFETYFDFLSNEDYFPPNLYPNEDEYKACWNRACEALGGC